VRKRDPRLAAALATWIALAALAPGAARAEAGQEEDGSRRRRLVHPRTQVPTVRNGGVLNTRETAFVAYVDGQLLPPALMMSVQHGLSYWVTLGVDVGGGYGTFQALLRLRMENLPPIANHRFFWGGHIRTGFKRQVVDISQDLAFEDVSWVLTYENTFSVRLGAQRRHVLYLDTIFYVDFDLTNSGRQVDLYLVPAVLGYEVVIGAQWNFFIEAGFAWSINGTETRYGLLYAGDVFPVATIGFAYRFPGHRTALDSF
jgi:hypothetical protein